MVKLNRHLKADPGLISPRVMVKGSKNAVVTIMNETNTRFVIGKGLPLATMQIMNKEDIKSSVEELNTETSNTSANLSDANQSATVNVVNDNDAQSNKLQESDFHVGNDTKSKPFRPTTTDKSRL